ncbi:hypothetical protein PIB30_112842, partial [Stylosanthes scabra]|nr:hypothetical protein [Stylosanthes scabra]
MDAYRDTYEYHLNPIPGQAMWETTQHTRPQAPIFKRKPGPLTKKRRKDADEGNTGTKKNKQDGGLKRKLRQFSCHYCGSKGHTKRGCSKKRADDVAAA